MKCEKKSVFEKLSFCFNKNYYLCGKFDQNEINIIMKTSKIGLDFNKVEHARGKAREIANQVQDFVGNYTTVAVERTLCRLLGIDGVDANDVPLPNVVVEELKSKGVLNQGVMFYIGNAMLETKMSAPDIAEHKTIPIYYSCNWKHLRGCYPSSGWRSPRR